MAASTLAVATLFNPLRRRVRRAVDRRFNQPHYQAERVLAELSVRLPQTADADIVASA